MTRAVSSLLFFSLLLSGLSGCEAESPAPALAVARAQVAFPDEWQFPAEVDPVLAPDAMVSSTDRYATEVGLDILREGGNAVDAAIAIAFALAVVHPSAGNIGGGGFMVFRSAEGEVLALDFRERAPAAAQRDMYLDDSGELTDASIVGHLASGVPGTVRGLWEAHQRLARLEWTALVQPAIELAEGFTVGSQLSASLREFQGSLSLFEATRDAFLPGGSLPAMGTVLRQPELAATLTRIRDAGPEGFYSGETAGLIVAEMARGGGIITTSDLAEYTAVWREPVTFRYRGYTVHSMPPSSSGGATLALMANLLEPYPLGAMRWHSPESIHLMAEAWKRAYADRNQVLADPDFVTVPLTRMISPEYAAERGGGISRERATPSTEIGPGAALTEGESTTHFSIVDEEGNAVALTTTLNSSYGSKVTVAGAGFLLNNEMDDFASRPGFPNQFGLVQGEQNAIEPGKRMLSAMTPTIVETADGALFLVAGTPGGSTIITTVFQVLSNVVDFGMNVAQAVNAPRVHHQHLPDRIEFEADGLDPAIVAALGALGHTLEERSGISGDVQAILVLPDGTISAYSDPRRGGTAAGY
ncbi:MAG: gamma-glutamyltransferase [Gemmatimonadota bacterium]